MRCRSLLVIVLLSAPGSVSAQDKGEPAKHGTGSLYHSLRDVINAGAELFNKQGDHAGCYRVFQGGLLSVKPFLPAEFQKKIDQSLAKAEGLNSFGDKAFQLRTTLDEIRAWANAGRSLWDRLGGDEGVAHIVEDFVALAAVNKAANVTRDGTRKVNVPLLKQQLIDFISSVSGGPYKYAGKNMKEAHKGMGILNSEFDALMGDLSAALQKNKVVPADARAFLQAAEGLRQDIVEKTGAVPAPPTPAKKGEPKDPNAGQLQGKVTFQGKPAPPGFVTLVDGDGRKFSTSIHEDGTYRFKTQLAPGKYSVAIDRAPGAVIPAKLDIPQRYRSEKTSELRFEIVRGKNEMNLELSK